MPKEDTQFKSQGLGIQYKQEASATKLPQSVVDYIKANYGSMSEFLRDAAYEKLSRDAKPMPAAVKYLILNHQQSKNH